jgi:outer membrane autotransporter protein
VDLKSVLTAGYRESDISRNLSFAGRYAEGRLKSFGINFDLELSVLFVDILGVELYPFAGLSSYLESRNSFAESGAGEANLYFGGDSVFYSAFNAGLELRRRANSLAYYAGFGAKRTFNNPDMTLNIYNQDFTIKPFDVGTVFSLKAGAVKKFSDLVSLYGGAEAELNADYTNISFNLGMRSYW